MILNSIHFRGHRCFKTEWAGYDCIKPVNVIIGRNNTGKSHLLDLTEALCLGRLDNRGWSYRLSGILDPDSLRRVFQQGTSSSDLSGDHWEQHGRHYANKQITWETDANANVLNVKYESSFDPTTEFGNSVADAQFKRIQVLFDYRRLVNPLVGTNYLRLLADRDIRPEPPSLQLTLRPDGGGASNIIRRYILTSNSRYPREIIQRDLLDALNKIFGSDGTFTEIQVKVHDEANNNQPEGHWEVYLGEAKKGLIPLSNSGSGLKTVILVLLNLLVVPAYCGVDRSRCTFAFEELENNLHPSLLRRLFQYLENYALTEKATIFLTTHSSAALDLFGVSKNAQIIHVTHDGKEAKATTVSAHFDHLGVISELGAKPSDLLQSNGIIWVEGPSDCIYINRWLDIYTEGRLQEGRDYLCAFYGGSLLARTQFASPTTAEKELVNLFRVNPNIVVICDGDRSAQGARVKDRVRRISAEVRRIPNAHIWVTEAREIENYVPGVVLAMAMDLRVLPDPTKYEAFFPRKGSPGSSYLESKMKRKGLDKMDLAVLCAPLMDKLMMSARFEWEIQMKQLVDRIDAWNR